jgi:Flp pilus assembly protein TadD
MMNHDFDRRNALSGALRCAALMLIFLLPVACAPATVNYDDSDSPAAGMVRLAEQLRARGDNVGAADFYQRAVQRDPKDALAHKGLAAALEATGHMAAAADEYRAVVKLKPRDGDAWRSLGRVSLAMDQSVLARDAYKAALGIDGDDAKALNGLGVALNNLGDHQGAQKQFEKALKEDSGNLATFNNLAYSYILDGKYDEAIRLLEPRVTSPGATPALRQNLALAYGLAGMDADAERVAKIDLPPARVKEALAYYHQRRAELAVSTAPYAELGTYPTQALAEAEIAAMQKQIDAAGADLRPVILPQVAVPGGTPRFALRMMGCSKPEDLKVFCDQMAKNGMPCEARGLK